MRGRNPFRTSKTFASLLLTIVLAGTFGVLVSPRPARAIPVEGVGPADVAAGAGAVSSAVSNSTTAANQVKQTFWDVLKISLTNTAALAVLNGVNYFAQKVAYDTANYVASGGQGQKPFFHTDGLGDYLTNTAKDAAADVLGTLSQDPASFQKLGFNLCAPTDPRVALNIKIGFLNGFPGLTGGVGPKPVCSWDTLSHNWDQFRQLDSTTVLNNIGVMFSPGQSSLSAAIQVNNAALDLIGKKQQAAINEYVANNGFLANVSKIGGKVLTPADTIKQQLNLSLQEGWKQGDKTVAITGSAFGNAAFGILPAALQTFTNTLAERMMKKVFDKGLITLNSILNRESDQTLSFNALPSQGGQAAAELANASLLTPKILSITNYNELTDFSACPYGATRGPNNCVMDGQFFAGVNRSVQGAGLTVRQAMQQGFLNPNWPLLPLAHPKNVAPTCYAEAYCYSNLVKLRRANIIPVGWELAANSPFNDLSHPVTLGEAMNAFEDCPRNADGSLDTAQLPDPLHPWCHLVDPEWVLKYPEEICRQQAPGPTLVSSQSSVRTQVCVDAASCIAQDASGSCVGGYGYCVRDRNVWNLNADSCPAQYASCTTFARATGGTFSFLSNTLDSGACNSQNAGCRQYSQSQNAVPNPGFEDVLNGQPRDWTLDANARFNRSGLLSARGANAVGVLSGAPASAPVYSLQPSSEYVLSGAALQEQAAASPTGTITLSFLKADGTPVAGSSLTTTCTGLAAGAGVSLSIATTHLGYLSAACRVTTPPDTAMGKLTLSSNSGAAGNRTWFDDLGLYGASFSASPYDGLTLNGQAAKCASDQAGCTDLIPASGGTLNLVRNPSFESAAPAGGPAFWTADAALYEQGTFKSFDGASAMRLGAAALSQDVQGLLGAAAYAFSVSSKVDGAGPSGSPVAVIQLYDALNAPVAPTSVSGCDIAGTAMRLSLATGSAYARSVCGFTTPDGAAFARVTMTAAGGSSTVVDATQMELAVQATDYHDGHAASSSHVYLKVAPEGLKCSGPDQPAACAGYAPACRRDEVGCNSYRPDAGGIAIPAVTSGGDACPTECVGYDTFKEEPSNFNDARFPLFLVPSTANSCAASESGCAEFTNVQKLAQGGESREYFSYLRLCAKPDQNSGTFYTWEGNDARGYQLRTWNLLKSNLASVAGSADPTGGNAPCTKLVYDNAARPACADDAASSAAASCTKAELLSNPDCREFYDVAGNIHYRLYSKTVVVSDACTEYRITAGTEGECGSHGGLWRNGECHYFASSAESRSCRAAAAGCRAYSGNASRNVRIDMSADFESGTAEGWAPGAGATVQNSNESVTAGGHSLRVDNTAAQKDVAANLQSGKSYLLTFWAKGSGDLSIAFSAAGDQPFTYNRLLGASAPLALGTEWKPYQVGPVSVVRAPASDPADPSKDEQLRFDLAGTGQRLLYLDNVSLREITDDLYLLKDSWHTPASCDQTPTGASSPQYMLGCSAYHDRLNRAVTLKSFDRICRPEAVGCEALYDTHHTPSPFPQTFSAICALSSACVPSGGSTTCTCKIGGQDVCQVASGAVSCRYDVDDAVSASHVSPEGDTVRIPSDGLIYLVNDSRYACDAGAVGCTAMGDKTLNRDRTAVQSWATTYLKNDPASYATTLCRKSEEFCQAYTRTADGSTAYFKDPGLRTCEFRDGAAGATGWFKKGTDEACYPDYLQAGTQYGIWKNSDPAYAAWAGECQPQFDRCKEFIDPRDTGALHPNGQPYYAILNDRLDAKTCQNRVSLTQSPAGADAASACVLFWQTDNLTKTYDSAASYAASDAQHGGLVNAVSAAGTNDTNIVIRVQRDRQCGEWLDCRSSENVFNPTTGQYQNVCTAFGLCAQFERVGNTTHCVRYVDSPYSGKTLTAPAYAARETGWQGMEYTGFAIPNEYPVNELVTVDISSGAGAPNLRLVRTGGNCSGAYGSSCGPAGDPGTCLGPSGNRQCVYPIDDGRKVTSEDQLSQSQVSGGYPAAACRAYPDENAPFPSSVADPAGWNLQGADLNAGNPVLIGPSPAFAGANVCQRRLVNGVEVSNCECNYLKVQYGSGAKYFPAADSDIPSGFCSSGAFDGYECDPLATGARTKDNLSCCSQTSGSNGLTPVGNGCDDGAQCTRLSKIDRVVGYEGQCLERDYTTPINNRSDEYACATWRPVGLIGGSRDIYNQNQSAGYFAVSDRRFYCVGRQDAWALQFSINPSDGSQSDFATPGPGPLEQLTNNYFGPGLVTNGNPRRVLSQNVTCGDNDQVPAGDWCIWPTTATKSIQTQLDNNNPPQTVSCNPAQNQFPGNSNPACSGGYTCLSVNGSNVCGRENRSIDANAIGILGCYEVADEGSFNQTFIEYPYVGPALYRQQLASIYFQMTNAVYREGIGLDNLPTNPLNDVTQECNDDNDDSNVADRDIANSHRDVTVADLTQPLLDSNGVPVYKDGIPQFADNTQSHKSLFYLDEKNGWKIDVSNGGGVILLSASFDQNGLLKSVRVAADDRDDSGTFGINRMGFVFRPGCQEIAQVDQAGEFGATQSFTNIVNAYRTFDPSIVGFPPKDVYDQAWALENACRPFGAVGSISEAPPQKPWTYAISRGASDVAQCTVADYDKAATYRLESPETLSSSSERNATYQTLRRLFRRITGLWQYVHLKPEGGGGTYQPDPGQLYDERDIVDPTSLTLRTSLGSLANNRMWQPPRIAAVDLASCDAGKTCKTARLDDLTVNGRTDGAIPGADGTMSVTAKFFAWASHNAMPILQRTVLWGDLASAEPPAKGWYKNQKPFCSPDTSDTNAIGECQFLPGLTCSADSDCPARTGTCQKTVNAFGNTPGACNVGAYQFDHTYTCSFSDLQRLPKCVDVGGLATNAPCYRLTGSSPACIYRPKVQITDNWGWCNCSGSGCRVAGGAYGGACAAANPPADARPWTEFAGEIDLQPSVPDAQAFLSTGP